MPVIELEKCTRCLKCVKDCPAQAITIETGEIADTCIHCGHCVAICPEMAVKSDFGDVFPLQQPKVTPEDFRSLTAGIRSCRSYLPKEIPDAVLLKLVENMKHYPSASNARPIQVTIVRSKEKVKLLNDLTAEALIRMFSSVTSPVISLFIRLFIPSLDLKKLKKYKDSFIEKKKTNDSLICHHAPAVLLFHGEVSKTGMAEADANIWAAYTYLFSNTLGLGTCFNGFIVKAMGKKSKLNPQFKIPANHQVYASLLIGYPKVKYKNETSRMSPKVVLF
ncbi:MAG TPA: nitroreductase family protein [Prolixibacteraceae bacterium]|nr:nitroreductase family protein [Prolixibacteraceae bacterium]